MELQEQDLDGGWVGERTTICPVLVASAVASAVASVVACAATPGKPVQPTVAFVGVATVGVATVGVARI